ncbi:xylulokinase [Sphaerotilus montanus]|uniref:Xylulose kinase n=1 Tax=Sphaerotilus montanus TaxID=522889 RepID=A0A7Y9UJ50_9BURK|nr:xylulokinase [Sphaerotilus montanus]NYG32415.1 xylulokinase [Sphaerotilus montanus]NZD57570.1 xylulokinase [Sphaerotilus montanus]
MYLGIDLGTSEVKFLLLDAQHQIHAVVGEPLTVQRPQPLWSEQAPGEWWAATERAMQRLKAEHGAALAQVRAIGLSGQMHGAVLMDAAGEVLRPAILWNDGRSGAECVELEAACPRLHDIAGNLAMPGFTAPKLLWVRKHEPDLFARTATVLLPKDWLRFMLTGERVGEMSDAAGTLWLDVAERRWSAEVLAACGMTEVQMPRLVEGSEVSGVLKAELAARWGLPAGVVIAGGGGDNAASAVGIGAVRPGEGFVSLGTSGVIFLTSDRFRPNPASAMHAFCHALPGTWHQMSVMLSAANGLRWVTHLVGAASEAALLEQVAQLTPQQRARAPLFLPYLNGERTPHNNPHAQGCFFGLTNDHDAAALGYAVVEGVTFGLLDGWHSLGVQPGEVESLSLVGGGARSALWAQLLASAIGVPMVTRRGGEAGGALGAARLAWLADGGAVEEVCRAPQVAATFAPDAAEAAVLGPRHARFKALYRAVEGLFPTA